MFRAVGVNPPVVDPDTGGLTPRRSPEEDHFRPREE
jgi:hypothetical protein